MWENEEVAYGPYWEFSSRFLREMSPIQIFIDKGVESLKGFSGEGTSRSRGTRV